MTLIHRESRPTAPVLAAGFEPLNLMRGLIRWDPFRDLEFPEVSGSFAPTFDIKETEKGYIFTADLPGIRQEDLDINLTGNRLTISGKREFVEAKEGEKVFIQERAFGSFCRTFSLPEGVDSNGVIAELKNGVLMLTVPKVPEVQPRKINISMN